MNIRDLSKFCLDFFFPHRCFSCKQIVQDNGGLCSTCWLKISFISKPCCVKCSQHFSYLEGSNTLCLKCIGNEFLFDKLYFVLNFTNASKKLIHSFKFHDQIYLSKFFAKLMYNYWQDQLTEIDYIIPVPMHKFRMIERKFNQAALLATHIAKFTKKKILLSGLIKYKKTPRQAILNKQQRKINIKNSIIVNEKYFDLIKGKKILLVDDVFTTGATINECTKALKKAGASLIIVIVIARVLHDIIEDI